MVLGFCAGRFIVSEVPISLGADDFVLFGVARQFSQDRAGLDVRWKALQSEAHPDRFAAQSASAQRQALQWSVRINEAYQRLKDPLRRAAYLCELAGMPIQAESNTAMPARFLMQQIEWREALDDASALHEVESLQAEVAAFRTQALADCAQALDTEHDPARAVALVRSLMFVERFIDDIERRRDQLPSQAST